MSNARAALLAAVLMIAPAAEAETLQQAMVAAMSSSPMLQGQQARQRATEEVAAQARASWRPTVSVTVNAEYQRIPVDSFNYAAGSAGTNDGEAVVTLNQPLYTGGRVAGAVRAAEARIQAGRHGVRATEQQVLGAVVLAYMDVLRDTEILGVRQADLATLQRQARETTARFRLGAAVTRTDVDQAEAQAQGAVASLAAARATLQASRAAYRAAVGSEPGPLMQPARLPGLPATLDAALDEAEAANPALMQSALAAQASAADVATARAAWNPTIGVQGIVGVIGGLAPLNRHTVDREVTGLLTFTQPLLSGGLIASQVRQARDREAADDQATVLAGRQAAQAAATSWSQMQEGGAQIEASVAQVSAAADALRGAQLEYGYGLRTTLDVLIADQTLRAAQVALAGSRHDTVVAEANLLAAIGRLQFGMAP